jgi:hypothetical protein
VIVVPDDLSFDLLAAALRRDAEDLETFHEVLAEKLTAALPTGTVRVRRGGLPLQTRRPLAELSVELGDTLFSARREAGRYEHRLAHVVRGIALKTDTVPFPTWLDTLVQALVERAKESEATRKALETFLT